MNKQLKSMKTNTKSLLFGSARLFYYRNIIKAIGIGGLDSKAIKNYNGTNEELIPTFGEKKNPNKPEIKCLVSIPSYAKRTFEISQFIMMYPDNEFLPETPTFFVATLTDMKAMNSYIYCLKWTEIYQNKILPLVLFIHSYKEDIDQFKYLLEQIYQNFLQLEIHNENGINEYKHIELINIFIFLYTNLVKPCPHTNIRINVPQYKNFTIDFYYSSNYEIPCNKTDTCIVKLFTYLDQSIIIKTLFRIYTENSVIFISSQPSILYNILTAFSKLIFPLVWVYSFLPVVPISMKKLLEQPMLYLFGILRGKQKIVELIKEGKKELVIDCDTNNIYTDKKYIPFCPLPSSELADEIVHLCFYNGEIRKFKKENNKYLFEEVLFLKEGSVIIDCEKNNKLMIENNETYMSVEEATSLRLALQTVKERREMFENNVFAFKKKKKPKSYEKEIYELICNLIMQKINNYEDPLHIACGKCNNYMNIIKRGKYHNNNPGAIMDNILSNPIANKDFNNAIIMNYNIPQFMTFDKIEYLFEKYKGNKKGKIKKIIEEYHKRKPNLENKNDINKAKEDEIIPFYGNDGFINTFKLFMSAFESQNVNEEEKKKQDETAIEREFYNKFYRLPVFEEVCDMLSQKQHEGENKQILSFIKEENEKVNKVNIKEPNLKSTLALLLVAFRDELKEEKKTNKFLKGEYINELFKGGAVEDKDKIEFPYYGYLEFIRRIIEENKNDLENPELFINKENSKDFMDIIKFAKTYPKIEKES